MKRRIDIIGAGISGLATAYYLIKYCPSDAMQIHIWEKERIPGGLAGSFSTPDFTVEKFYHHLYRRDVALQELIDELGLGKALIWRPATTGAYYFRQPFRLSSPLDVLRFTPLPLWDRLRLGWLAIQARSITDWQTLDDRAVKEYIVRVAGERVYRVVWEPLLHGKFGQYAEKISAAWLWSKLVDRGGSRNAQGHELLGYLRGGLGGLFDRLVTHIQQAGHHVHLGTAIRHLSGTPAGITDIHTDEGVFPADLIISGTQVPDLAKLLPDSLTSYRVSLERIKFLANLCLVITLKRQLSEFYWTNVTEADAPFIGIIEQTNWADRGDFNQKHVVYISAYLTHDDPRLALNAGQLTECYLPSIQKMFPTFRSDMIEEHTLWTAPYAQPVVHTGYRHLIPHHISPIPNLFVCTMAQIYPNDRQVSNGVAMARKTAQLVSDCMG